MAENAATNNEAVWHVYFEEEQLARLERPKLRGAAGLPRKRPLICFRFISSLWQVKDTWNTGPPSDFVFQGGGTDKAWQQSS